MLTVFRQLSNKELVQTTVMRWFLNSKFGPPGAQVDAYPAKCLQFPLETDVTLIFEGMFQRPA